MPRSPLHGDLTIHDSGRSDDGAPTLVLLHGVSESASTWAGAVRRWQEDYRIVAWDARGHGDSGPLGERDIEDGIAETHLGDAISLLENLARHGVDRPVLVGHSMGGGTAAALAGTRPDLARAVVLEDPALGVRTDDLALPGSDVEAAHELVLLRSPRFATAANIALPTLLVTGDSDVMWTPSVLERLAAVGSSRIEVGIVTGAGHHLHRDAPEGFHAIVDPWIRERFGDDG